MQENLAIIFLLNKLQNATNKVKQGGEEMKFSDAKIPIEGYGKTKYLPIFREEEKEKASKIIKQLEGMTIYEAQQFLSKVSEAIIYVHTL